VDHFFKKVLTLFEVLNLDFEQNRFIWFDRKSDIRNNFKKLKTKKLPMEFFCFD